MTLPIFYFLTIFSRVFYGSTSFIKPTSSLVMGFYITLQFSKGYYLIDCSGWIIFYLVY